MSYHIGNTFFFFLKNSWNRLEASGSRGRNNDLSDNFTDLVKGLGEAMKIYYFPVLDKDKSTEGEETDSSISELRL